MQFTQRQQMATMAFVAYTGMYGKPVYDPVYFAGIIEGFLKDLVPFQGTWNLVWGPGVTKSPWINLTDANVAFIARNSAPPDGYAAEYALAIRGTDPISLIDIIAQASNIYTQVDWTYGAPPPNAKIAAGVNLGMDNIFAMIPAQGVPGAGLSATQFLAEAVQQAAGPVHVLVTGHSLAGALSPATALRLRDTQGPGGWDPTSKAVVGAVPVAGFTPGSPEFADYYNSRLVTDRVYNHYDIVPDTYDVNQMTALYNIYDPVAKTPELMKMMIALTIEKLNHSGVEYRQIEASTPPLAGAYIWPDGHIFIEQMLYQHVTAYLVLLGLSDYVNIIDILTGKDQTVDVTKLGIGNVRALAPESTGLLYERK
jgi:hypothetical protein